MRSRGGASFGLLAGCLIGVACSSTEPAADAELLARVEQMERQLWAAEQRNELLAALIARLEPSDHDERVAELLAQLLAAIRSVGAMSEAEVADSIDERGESGAESAGAGFGRLVASLPRSEFWESEQHLALLKELHLRDPLATDDVLHAIEGSPADLEQFALAMCETNLRSSVRFQTERPGAWIHRSFLGRDENVRSEQPTHAATEDLCIGIYRFWVERSGHRTSDVVTLPIIREELTVSLEEHDR